MAACLVKVYYYFLQNMYLLWSLSTETRKAVATRFSMGERVRSLNKLVLLIRAIFLLLRWGTLACCWIGGVLVVLVCDSHIPFRFKAISIALAKRHFTENHSCFKNNPFWKSLKSNFCHVRTLSRSNIGRWLFFILHIAVGIFLWLW